MDGAPAGPGQGVGEFHPSTPRHTVPTLTLASAGYCPGSSRSYYCTETCSGTCPRRWSQGLQLCLENSLPALSPGLPAAAHSPVVSTDPPLAVQALALSPGSTPIVGRAPTLSAPFQGLCCRSLGQGRKRSDKRAGCLCCSGAGYLGLVPTQFGGVIHGIQTGAGR